MAESCVSSPTLTTTQVITTNIPVTLIGDITTSLPAITTVYTLTPSCSLATCVAAPTTVTSIIPGDIVTTETSFITTTTSELTLTTTLFGSSCSQSQSETDGLTNTATDSPSRTRTSSTSTSTTPTTGPTRSQITSTVISTQSDGRVFTSLVTITAAPVNDSGNNGSGGGLKMGPIIGGAVGGVVILVIAALSIWYCLKKRATAMELDNLFNDDIKVKPYMHHVEHLGHGSQSEKAKFESKIGPQELIQRQPVQQNHDQYQGQQQQLTDQAPQQQQEQGQLPNDPQDQRDAPQKEQREYDDPREEKKRLKKMYDNAMTIANGVENEINGAGPSRYHDSGSLSPSMSPIYSHQVLPVPVNAYHHNSAGSRASNGGHARVASGSIDQHGQVPHSGYSNNISTGHGSLISPVDPRFSQYGSVSSPGSSRPTSTIDHGHQADYYQSTQGLYSNNPQVVQVGSSAGNVTLRAPPSVGTSSATGWGTMSDNGQPRSEKRGQGYHLDGAQYQERTSNEPPPPAYIG